VAHTFFSAPPVHSIPAWSTVYKNEIGYSTTMAEPDPDQDGRWSTTTIEAASGYYLTRRLEFLNAQVSKYADQLDSLLDIDGEIAEIEAELKSRDGVPLDEIEEEPDRFTYNINDPRFWGIETNYESKFWKPGT
jgi:hypothetical protein